MEKPELAIFGGSFNPAAIHHQEIIKELCRHFAQVLIIPCGPRPDKSSTNETSLEDRRKISELAFSNIPNTILDLSDLEKEKFTSSLELYEKFSKNYNCYLVIGADLILGGAENKSEIQKSWFSGNELWANAQFVILNRPDIKLDLKDLPPKSKVIKLTIPGSSKKIRELIKKGQDVKDLLPEAVYQYIQSKNLYK